MEVDTLIYLLKYIKFTVTSKEYIHIASNIGKYLP